MSTRTFSLFAIIIMLLCPALAQCASEDWRQIARDIKLGDSRQNLENALRQFEPVTWNSLTNHYRLRFLGSERILAWRTGPLRQVGEGYILAVFSADGALTDLLRFEPQVRVFPLTRGTYAERLGSVKKGMNVDEVYRLVGETMPYRYRRDANGKWLVEFSYQGAGPDFYIYEADAATGTISSVLVSAI